MDILLYLQAIVATLASVGAFPWGRFAAPATTSSVAEWAGAVATFLAVLVALFGARLWAWLSRPKLAIAAGDGVDALVTSPPDGYVVSAQLVVSNGVGRDTARDVEATLTVWSELDDLSKAIGRTLVGPVVLERNLIFDSGGRNGAVKASIPPGGSRRLEFVQLARGPKLQELLRDNGGKLSGDVDGLGLFFVASSVNPTERRLWLERGKKYDIEVVVNGTNFSARTYKGELSVAFEHRPEFPTSEKYLHRLVWESPLELVAPSRRIGWGRRKRQDRPIV